MSASSHRATNSSRRAASASASSNSAFSCGISESGRVPPAIDGIGLASAYSFVTSKSWRRYASAACATATRPVKRRWPIISKGASPAVVIA